MQSRKRIICDNTKIVKNVRISQQKSRLQVNTHFWLAKVIYTYYIKKKSKKKKERKKPIQTFEIKILIKKIKLKFIGQETTLGTTEIIGSRTTVTGTCTSTSFTLLAKINLPN